MKRSVRTEGILCTVAFVAMGTFSVVVALVNEDGSIARPLLAAFLFGVFWSAFSLLGILLLVTHHRYRLFLGEQRIKQVGCIRSVQVAIDDIHSAEWQTHPPAGSLRVNTGHERFRIRFESFSAADRELVITFLREHLAADCQQGWPRFHDQFLTDNPRRSRHQRQMKRLLSLLLFVFAVVFAIVGLRGHGIHYMVISFVNIAASLWILRRPRNPLE
ncbi:MAG: hypothetical protein ACYTGL_01580 [Planctomycetota bacterium]